MRLVLNWHERLPRLLVSEVEVSMASDQKTIKLCTTPVQGISDVSWHGDQDDECDLSQIEE